MEGEEDIDLVISGQKKKSSDRFSKWRWSSKTRVFAQKILAQNHGR